MMTHRAVQACLIEKPRLRAKQQQRLILSQQGGKEALPNVDSYNLTCVRLEHGLN